MNLFAKVRAFEFIIDCADITSFDSDVIVLQYSKNIPDTNLDVIQALYQNGNISNHLPNGYRYLTNNDGRVKAENLLVLEVPPLLDFNYQHIRELSNKALKILAKDAPHTKHIGMMMYGSGYGVDDIEAALAQFGGILDAIELDQLPQELQRISIVDVNYERVKSIRLAFEKNLSTSRYATKLSMERNSAYLITAKPQQASGYKEYRVSRSIKTAGIKSARKKHIFVAMPFKKDMSDLYRYGIQIPTRRIGFVCERMDQRKYTGAVLEKIKKDIKKAELVVAILTDSNPNVYLEIGYAWGINIPTVLLIKKGKEPEFDVRGEKFLEYESIQDLEERLKNELRELSKGFKKS